MQQNVRVTVSNFSELLRENQHGRVNTPPERCHVD